VPALSQLGNMLSEHEALQTAPCQMRQGSGPGPVAGTLGRFPSAFLSPSLAGNAQMAERDRVNVALAG
jgi:hypothetical protein